jgi:hypothetical protein
MAPKIRFHFANSVARCFIKPCRRQPATGSVKLCSACCAAREDNNLFFMTIRSA